MDLNGYVACGVGFIGGMINLALTEPLLVLTSGLLGSGLVSLILAVLTIVGQGIGKIIMKEIDAKWKKYKLRKRPKL